MRHKNYVTTFIEGRMDRKMGKGRPRKHVLHQVVEDVGAVSYQETSNK